MIIFSLNPTTEKEKTGLKISGAIGWQPIMFMTKILTFLDRGMSNLLIFQFSLKNLVIVKSYKSSKSPRYWPTKPVVNNWTFIYCNKLFVLYHFLQSFVRIVWQKVSLNLSPTLTDEDPLLKSKLLQYLSLSPNLGLLR